MVGDTKYLKGLNGVLSNLNKEVKKIEGRTLKGLIRAAIIVRRDMDKTSPKIPVDTGNLRSSFFTITSNGAIRAGKNPKFKGDKASKLRSSHSSALSSATSYSMPGVDGPFVVLGFSAFYAVYVHELLKKYKRPGSGAKFLENAIDRNKAEILEVIRKEAKIR